MRNPLFRSILTPTIPEQGLTLYNDRKGRPQEALEIAKSAIRNYPAYTEGVDFAKWLIDAERVFSPQASIDFKIDFLYSRLTPQLSSALADIVREAAAGTGIRQHWELA